MADIVCETQNGTVGIHWGKYIRDGKVTAEGMPVMTEAMQKFGKDILVQYPNYFKKGDT